MNKYLLLITIIFLSCQEEITLDLPQADDKLVIEGSIENGFPPYIIITNNQGYFDPIDSVTYTNLFLTNVDSVKIWYFNNGIKILKTLQKIDGLDSLPPIYTDIDHLESQFSQEELIPYDFSKSGRTYYLEIKWNNQIISSSTTIPEVTPLDCLWVEKSENGKKDYMYDIRALYSDPIDQNNNILIKSKRVQHYEINRKDTLSCKIINYPDFSLKLIDAGSDILINGQTFETYFPRPKESGFPYGSYNTNRVEMCGDDSLAINKDIVLIKFCQIDEPSLKFWRGLRRQAGNNGNPFAEPMNLVSNINNGLGVFTGYGATYYLVPIRDTVIYDEYSKLNILDIF